MQPEELSWEVAIQTSHEHKNPTIMWGSSLAASAWRNCYSPLMK